MEMASKYNGSYTDSCRPTYLELWRISISFKVYFRCNDNVIKIKQVLKPLHAAPRNETMHKKYSINDFIIFDYNSICRYKSPGEPQFTISSSQNQYLHLARQSSVVDTTGGGPVKRIHFFSLILTIFVV